MSNTFANDSHSNEKYIFRSAARDAYVDFGGERCIFTEIAHVCMIYPNMGITVIDQTYVNTCVFSFLFLSVCIYISLYFVSLCLYFYQSCVLSKIYHSNILYNMDIQIFDKTVEVVHICI